MPTSVQSQSGRSHTGQSRSKPRQTLRHRWKRGLSPLDWLRIVIAGVLGISTMAFLAMSLRWPLVGDAALMHYVVFLIEHGMAPYQVLNDVNMPGSFLVEMVVMYFYGTGDLAWRLFDLTLLVVAGGSFFVLTRRAGWFAGVFAACLFALMHGHDGLAQGGQSDLTIAVCLVAGTACLFVAVRTGAWWAAIGFGLLSGVAWTIKPSFFLLAPALLAVAVWALRERGRRWKLRVWAALGGMPVFPLVALIFLLVEGAFGAFLSTLGTTLPYTMSLGHKPLGYILLRSISPLWALVALWIVVIAVTRPRLDWDRMSLAAGVAMGLVSWLIGARGLAHSHYPLLAFLLPLIALDLTQAANALTPAPWKLRPTLAGVLAVVALGGGGVFLGPQSAWQMHRYRWWQTEFITSLDANLVRLGDWRLYGNVQCIDSVSGCGAALYRLRLTPVSGVLSDFLLFGRDDAAAVRNARATMDEDLRVHPPQVIVVSSKLHMDGLEEYRKLDRWPELQQILASDYRLETEWVPKHTERWSSVEEMPAGYRIYVRRAGAEAGPPAP